MTVYDPGIVVYEPGMKWSEVIGSVFEKRHLRYAPEEQTLRCERPTRREGETQVTMALVVVRKKKRDKTTQKLK